VLSTASKPSDWLHLYLSVGSGPPKIEVMNTLFYTNCGTMTNGRLKILMVKAQMLLHFSILTTMLLAVNRILTAKGGRAPHRDISITKSW